MTSVNVYGDLVELDYCAGHEDQTYQTQLQTKDGVTVVVWLTHELLEDLQFSINELEAAEAAESE